MSGDLIMGNMSYNIEPDLMSNTFSKNGMVI